MVILGAAQDLVQGSGTPFPNGPRTGSGFLSSKEKCSPSLLRVWSDFGLAEEVLGGGFVNGMLFFLYRISETCDSKC